ncbi:MAG: hypothetical protein U9Q06_01840 [Nanoarchaeota archaeon]|nr:hypothetical protein [Nanoarchaeota archaeon]
MARDRDKDSEFLVHGAQTFEYKKGTLYSLIEDGKITQRYVTPEGNEERLSSTNNHNIVQLATKNAEILRSCPALKLIETRVGEF